MPVHFFVLTLGGVIYALAFPPHGWSPLVFVGLGMLVWGFRGLSAAQAFRRGLIWGLTAFGFGLSWFGNIFSVLSPVLWIILALFPACFAALSAFAASRGLKRWSLAAFMALAWCATEFIRCEIMPLRFPWMSAGLALEPWPLVSWIGVYGLGLVVMFVVSGALDVGWRTAYVAPVVLVLWGFEPHVWYTASSCWHSVGVVQAESAPLSRYLELSEKTSGSTKLIVWPEYAVPKDVRASSDLATIQALAAKRNVIIVFGTQTSLGGSKWQNTALTVDGTRVLGEHGKHHTVHLFDDGESGTTMKAIDTPLGRMGTPVCFDCDFQDVVRHMTLDGAEFFAVPSMDAAHWGEKQHIQHAQLFRLRAAENRRPFVVAASSGVSQIISPNGWKGGSLPPMVEDVLDGRLTPEKELTFFTRWGWLTPWVAMASLLFWMIRLWKIGRANLKSSRP
jgi:apolipoprotein N-acyltransferase